MTLIRFTLSILIALSSSLVGAQSWTSPIQYPYAIGGDSGREAPAVTIMGSSVLMAYTSRTAAPTGDYYVYTATSSDGLHFSSPSVVYVNGSPAHASSNPALTVYNNAYYLSFTSSSGAQLLTSPNGVNWSNIAISTSVPVNLTPSMTVFTNTLYIGFRHAVSSGTAGIVLCSYTVLNGVQGCSLNDSSGTNYGPNLLSFGSQMIISYAAQDNTHDLLFYYYGNGYLGSAQWLAQNTTSSQPSSAYDGIGNPYLSYRANDGGHGIYVVRVLSNSNGGIMSGAANYTGWSSGGTPTMYGNLPGYQGRLFILYSGNDSQHYLYAISAQAN